MNVLGILNEIEDLIREVIMWLVDIPKTLFKILANPSWVTRYIDEELVKKSDRFKNYMSPIILYLICSVLLFFIIEQLGIFEYTDKKDDFSLDKILKNLSGTRGTIIALAFLSLPLLLALLIEVFRPQKLTRTGVQRMLQIQCYLLSPVILSIFAYLLIDFLNIKFSPPGDYGWPKVDAALSILTIVTVLTILIWFTIVLDKLIAKEWNCSGWKAAVVVILIFGGVAVFGGSIYNSVAIQNRGAMIDNTIEGAERVEVVLPETGEFHIEVGEWFGNPGNLQLGLNEKNDRTSRNANDLEELGIVEFPKEDRVAGELLEEYPYLIFDLINYNPELLSFDQIIRINQMTGSPSKNAKSITYGQIVTDSIQDNGDTSILKFNGRQGDLLTILIESIDSGAFWSVDVTDTLRQSVLTDNKRNSPNNFPISTDGDNVVNMSWLTLPTTGTFNIEISSREENFTIEASYKVALIKDYHNSKDGSLAYGQMFGVRIDQRETGLWKFTGEKGDTVDIDIEPFPFDEHMDLYFTVKDASGKSIHSEVSAFRATLSLSLLKLFGYLYVALLGLAIFRGFKAIGKAEKKADLQDQ